MVVVNINGIAASAPTNITSTGKLKHCVAHLTTNISHHLLSNFTLLIRLSVDSCYLDRLRIITSSLPKLHASFVDYAKVTVKLYPILIHWALYVHSY